MVQRIQSLWMALTVSMVCIVLLMPVMSFSAAEADFHLMTYGIRELSGQVLVWGGEQGSDALLAPVFSVCLAVLLAITALVPLVAIFFYRRRRVQIRLLGAEFALLLGAAGMLGYYIWTYHGIVSGYSDNFFLSFFPLLLVVAMLTNWLALRGVLHDEILVRAADRVR